MFTKDTARIHGLKGGQSTKKRLEHDPDYFSRIGLKGFEGLKKKFGDDLQAHFSAAGKKSWDSRRAAK